MRKEKHFPYNFSFDVQFLQIEIVFPFALSAKSDYVEIAIFFAEQVHKFHAASCLSVKQIDFSNRPTRKRKKNCP